MIACSPSNTSMRDVQLISVAVLIASFAAVREQVLGVDDYSIESPKLADTGKPAEPPILPATNQEAV